jgi:uncharacterized membrane protein
MLVSAAVLILVLIALHQISGLSTQLAKLKLELHILKDQLAKGQAAEIPAPGAAEPAKPVKPAKAAAAKARPVVVAEAPLPQAAPVSGAMDGPANGPETPAMAEKSPAAKPARDMEQALASRWFVWIGGIAIAIGGLLFVKYAHDMGLIPPFLRVALGLLLGAGLVAAGEFVRKNRPAYLQQDYVPAALSAAGLVTAFGSIYAAYALYDLVSPTLAFVGLALVALGAFALSRRQGPLIAALGLVGAYAAPAMIPSDNPSAATFFPYLLIILVASFYTMRGRDWWWLGYAAIGGSLAWSILWVGSSVMEVADRLPVGLFALALGAVATLIPVGRAILDDSQGSLLAPQAMSNPLKLATFGMAAGAIILAHMVFQASHATTTLVLFALGMAAVAVFGWLKRGHTGAAIAAALTTLVVLMAWPDVSFFEWAMDERGFWTLVPGYEAPARFRLAMFVALAGFAALGWFGVLRRDKPQGWALLAAGSAVLFLFGTWAKADFVMGDWAWAIAAVLLSGVLKSGLLLRRRDIALPEVGQAAGFLLAGMALLSVFAADRLFDGVWYTIAIAVLAAAFAWGSGLFPVKLIGPISGALAGFAALRLFVGREFWGEPQGLPLGSHWPLYGYSIPVVLFWQASRWLSARGFARSALGLEGLSLGLAIALVSLEIRVLMSGGITGVEPGLLETATHFLAWLGAAYGLARRQAVYSSLVSLWGSRLLLAASCAGITGLSLFLLNPVITGDALEGNALFNPLLLAYLAPVPLIALMARKLDGMGWGQFRNALGILALVLVFAYVTLATKRVFQDATLSFESESQGEFYAYSAVWLVLAVALFAAGIRMARQNIRYAGLAVMVLVVLKVFIADMADLGGLFRIISFIGLGLCLVGIGWLYTRFVQPPRKDAA